MYFKAETKYSPNFGNAAATAECKANKIEKTASADWVPCDKVTSICRGFVTVSVLAFVETVTHPPSSTPSPPPTPLPFPRDTTVVLIISPIGSDTSDLSTWF